MSKINESSVIVEKRKYLMDYSEIQRTVLINGVKIPGIICNLNYHLADIKVYSDGLVDCWKMVDLKGLRDVIQTEWLVPAVPNGKILSIHHLGYIEVKKGKWLYNKKSLEKNIYEIIRNMNPEMENLFNCFGRDGMVVNGVNVAWPPCGNPTVHKYQKPFTVFSKSFNGEDLWHIRKFQDEFHLVSIQIFEDDTVRISGCNDEKEYSFDEFLIMLRESEEFKKPEMGAIIKINSLGEITIGEKSKFMDFNFIIGEIEDTRDKIQGRKGKIQLCMEAFKNYTTTPNKENLENLRRLYESVPGHLRRYCGDMDTSDIPIRMILYGEKEIEQWSHYRVAKENGMDLPRINIPEIKEDEDV
jgi:hypothetical protein